MKHLLITLFVQVAFCLNLAAHESNNSIPSFSTGILTSYSFLETNNNEKNHLIGIGYLLESNNFPIFLEASFHFPIDEQIDLGLFSELNTVLRLRMSNNFLFNNLAFDFLPGFGLNLYDIDKERYIGTSTFFGFGFEYSKYFLNSRIHQIYGNTSDHKFAAARINLGYRL